MLRLSLQPRKLMHHDISFIMTLICPYPLHDHQAKVWEVSEVLARNYGPGEKLIAGGRTETNCFIILN